jgi:hypothetical protein
MTLPTSGTITYNDVNIEVGNASGTKLGMDWIRSVSKSTIGGATGAFSDLNSLHGKSYYKNNTMGNCNNGNCTTGQGNCGDHNCVNCYNSTLADCVNCDTQKYLQPYSNCDPTYNCTSNQVSVNCNCDCSIWCPCW